MASIKLKHSSGNGTIINSPAANPSSDITLKLPSTTGSAGQVLQVASANHSSTNAELEFAAASGGKILQVKYGFRTGSLSTTSTSYVDSGITVDITPSATNSKILILINYLGGVDGGSNSGQRHQVRILRDSTEIFTERDQDFMRFAIGNGQADYMTAAQFLQNLDSPSTTSAITYKLQTRINGSGTLHVWAGSNICVMEVAA